MLEDELSTDLLVLESHLDGMLGRIQQNSLTLKRLQAFEMRLLSLNSLPEIIDFILSETQALFGLDVVSLCLCDPRGEISSCLQNDGYDHQACNRLFLLDSEQTIKSHFALSSRPTLGQYQARSHDVFFAQNQAKPASVILLPLIRRGNYLGSLNFGSFHSDRFIRNMATDFIEHLASVVGVCLENTLNFETIRRTSLVDPLTGANNRRFLEQRMVEELDRCQRTRMPLSCLFMDLDFFKRINDGFGHQAGDYVLTRVASAIKKQLRSNDLLARYGGEEFVVLLSESDDIAAGAIAERIRSNIAVLSFEFADQNIAVTISVGAATFEPGIEGRAAKVSAIADDLIQAADAALYQAKHNGRNQVVNHGVIYLAKI